MSRRFLPAVLIVSALAISSQIPVNAQVSTGYTQSGVPAVSGTTVFIGQPPGTPTASFGAPPPTAGISNAGRAGISNSAPLPAYAPGPADTVVYYSQPAIEQVVTQPGASLFVTNVTGAPEYTAPAGAAPEAAAPEGAFIRESGGRQFNDLGPSYYADVLPSPRSTSLAEVAAGFKAQKPSVSARMLTNVDVEKLVGNKAGVSMANMLPPGPVGQELNALLRPPIPPGTQTTPSGQAGAKPSPVPPAPAGPNPAAGATTPQINPSPQTNAPQGRGRLPATSTILPLLGVLGLLGGGLGMWLRRSRH